LGEPKQFAALAGKPLVLWSVEAFRDHPSFAGLTLVLPPESVESPPAGLGTHPVGRRGRRALRLGQAGSGDRA
jgi:2-C-methyl-D-erythritol 4-phosphate cytidylyltransferase